jgi:ribosomal protein L39E
LFLFFDHAQSKSQVINPRIRWAHCKNQNKSIPRYIIIKLMKTKEKENLFKSPGGEKP